jgi:quinol monooxygenase YgiN
MIRHLVLWNLAADAEEDKQLIVAELEERFAALEELDGVERLEIRADIGETDGNWDVVLVGDYRDTAALDAYQAHPAHEEVAAYVRSVVSARASIDFEA